MLAKFYQSVDDIPLYNWIKCTQGNFEFVLINPNDEVEKSEYEQAFNVIFDSYINNNGISKTYERLLKMYKKKALLELDRVIKGDRHLETRIEIVEKEIENMKLSQSRGISVQETLVILSKFMGYRLDWKVISKSEYDTILKQYQSSNQTSDNG